MAERLCPGLPADWLNGWLAAIGALVLVPDLRLRWSDDPVPLAILTSPDDHDPVTLLVDAWPTEEDVARVPIARHLPGHEELTLKPSVSVWIDRASTARQSPQGWMLSSLHTDLAWSNQARDHIIERGQFHTPMPGRDNTIHDRFRKLVKPATAKAITASLDGVGARVGNYGLGFDVTRIASLADDTSQMVDPYVEIMALYGLALFPTRGDGRRRRQRGWNKASAHAGDLRWYSWRADLSARAVDALLDVVETRSGSAMRMGMGVSGGWEVVPYRSRGLMDSTRGFGSRRVAEP